MKRNPELIGGVFSNMAMIVAVISFIEKDFVCRDDEKISAASVGKKWCYRNCGRHRGGEMQWCEIWHDAKTIFGRRFGGQLIARYWKSNGSLFFSVINRRFDKKLADIAARFTQKSGIENIVEAWTEEHAHSIGYDLPAHLKTKSVKKGGI